LAIDSAAERRLTAAKAAVPSVTPRIVEAMIRIARENAILLSNQDTFDRNGGKGRKSWGDPWVL
jgi:hypothetical protein